MDPTAPDQPNNNDPAVKAADPIPSGSTNPQVQPGQYMVAESPVIATEPQSQTSEPVIGDPLSAAMDPVPNLGPDVISNIATQTPADPVATFQTTAPPPPLSPTATPSVQPDPTPFVPPTGPDQQGASSNSPSSLGKMKMIVIILVVLVIIAIAGAAVWYFLIQKKSTEPESSQTNETTTISEPSPPPITSESGFGEIPPSTSEATPAASPPVSLP